MNKDSYTPGYISLHRSGELHKRGEVLWELLEQCRLCPRECGVNRLEGETGFCNATSELKIASAHPHFGEERPLVGEGGSGTIFFSHCNLGCVFCQNWDISHGGAGTECSIEDLAGMMLALQQRRCHNINLVTPTQYSPHAVLALDLAAARGLRIPLVYNTSGWERGEVLGILDGIVDIYLSDLKYMSSEQAARYSCDAENYPSVTLEALLEMNRQVGVAVPGEAGVICRGLMIRHLVMPNHVSGSVDAMKWIAGHLPKETFVNIMMQYRPTYRAHHYPEISRSVTRSEYMAVVNEARRQGLTSLDTDL